MKKHFPGYFQPTKADFDKLWSKAFFSPDANVLLNLYRYKQDTRDRFLSLLTKIKQRLWVTNQATLEFLRNRIDVIQSQIDAFDRISDELQRSRKELSGRISEFSRHSAIDVKELSSGIGESLDKATEELKKLRHLHPDLLSDDSILKSVSSIFEGRVGEAFDKNAMPTILKTIDDRYSKGVPPGFAEKAKTADRQYGDGIVWLQLLEQAKSTKSPLIFITDDLKEDWWQRHKGRTIGPRPELIAEMAEVAQVSFYMYSPDSFLEYAGKYFEEQVDQATIKDVRNTQRRVIRDVKGPAINADELSHLLTRINRKLVIIREIERSVDSLTAEIAHLEDALVNVAPDEQSYVSFDLRTKKQSLMALIDRLKQEKFSKSVLERRIPRGLRTDIDMSPGSGSSILIESE